MPFYWLSESKFLNVYFALRYARWQKKPQNILNVFFFLKFKNRVWFLYSWNSEFEILGLFKFLVFSFSFSLDT